MHDVDGLNAGFASALLEQYLENPEAVPAEWRTLFESGSNELVATLPGLARLLEQVHKDGNGHALPIIEQTPGAYECGECGATFATTDEAAAHLAEVHPA